MVDRYGDFVRYKPALSGRTWLLWFGPGSCWPAASWCWR
jgi:cytochrome c-type biogenesis protein CcmH